jgi:DNA adenine methylase
MGHTDSPLRYPGGKTSLSNFIRLALEKNDLLAGHYVEPYAGGAGMALRLLLNGDVSHVHINDLDKSVYAFWYAVIKKTDELCRLIRDTPVTMKSWYRQKAAQENPSQYSRLDLGFSTFFLNRTNRSGILQGGVIGGKDQSGKWKLYARYNKRHLLEKIENIARHKNQISIYNQDAADFIRKVLPKLPKNSLVYLDPPYYAKGEGLYQNHYTHEDHAAVAKLIRLRIKQRWIVSYDDTSQIRELYEGYKMARYQLSYSAAERYKGSEVMFFCNDLVVPRRNNHLPSYD